MGAKAFIARSSTPLSCKQGTLPWSGGRVEEDVGLLAKPVGWYHLKAKNDAKRTVASDV